MPNEVESVKVTDPITTTPTEIIDLEGGQYNVLEAQNTTGQDITLTFGAANEMTILAGDKKLQPFVSSGKIKASAPADTTSGFLFVQLSRG